MNEKILLGFLRKLGYQIKVLKSKLTQLSGKEEQIGRVLKAIGPEKRDEERDKKYWYIHLEKVKIGKTELWEILGSLKIEIEQDKFFGYQLLKEKEQVGWLGKKEDKWDIDINIPVDYRFQEVF